MGASKQSFPPELKPRLAPQAMQDQLSYPPEFRQGIENSTYSMFLPRLVRLGVIVTTNPGRLKARP